MAENTSKLGALVAAYLTSEGVEQAVSVTVEFPDGEKVNIASTANPALERDIDEELAAKLKFSKTQSADAGGR